MKRIASLLARLKTPPRGLIARVFIVSAALAISPAMQHYIGEAVNAFADDLSNGSWSTTDASNSAAPPNGWPAGMAPNQVEPAARSNMGALRRWWERGNPALSTTGSAGAYVLTPTNTSYPTAYTQGEVYCAKANFTSVGNDTLNVNSLGAKKIYQASTSGPAALTAGTIQSGQQFCASYDAALNSGAGGFQLLTGSGLSASGLSNGTTGSGAVVLANSPTLVTPSISGEAQATGGAYSGKYANGSATNGTYYTAISSAALAGIGYGVVLVFGGSGFNVPGGSWLLNVSDNVVQTMTTLQAGTDIAAQVSGGNFQLAQTTGATDTINAGWLIVPGV